MLMHTPRIHVSGENNGQFPHGYEFRQVPMVSVVIALDRNIEHVLDTGHGHSGDHSHGSNHHKDLEEGCKTTHDDGHELAKTALGIAHTPPNCDGSLKDFLGQLGLEHYLDKLVDEEISAVDTLRKLSEMQLKEIGLKTGARAKIQAALYPAGAQSAELLQKVRYSNP